MNDIISIRRFVPILYVEGKLAGCGVITDDLFLTDAHAISACLNHYIEFDGRRIFLDKSNEVYIKDEKYDPYGYDLAVYRLHDVHSPFSLADGLPEVGQTLYVPYYGIEDLNFDITKAITSDSHEGNYFGANTSAILAVGNSGSPIILENKIYGLLNAGKPGENFCAFLSSRAILEQIKNLI